MTTETKREALLQRWDRWRKAISDGCTASWPRDEFESLLDAHEEEISDIKASLRVPYVSLYMDGRNEHGTHLLPAGAASIDPTEFNRGTLDPRDGTAEEIFAKAETLGHGVGHLIVVKVRYPSHEEDFWEFLGIDEQLTELLHGSPAEQSARIAKYV